MEKAIELFEKTKLETVGHSTEVNYTRYFRKFVDFILQNDPILITDEWKQVHSTVPKSDIKCANALQSYQDAARHFSEFTLL